MILNDEIDKELIAVKCDEVTNVFVPESYQRKGNYVLMDGSWINLNDLTKIKRKSTDICYFGGKSKGKTIILVYNAITKRQEWIDKGIEDKMTIYSNFKVNLKGVVNVDDITMLSSMKDGIFLADDLEKWLSSRLITNKEKASIIEIILNLGKRNVDIYWTCKRPMNVDIMLRDTTDFWIKVDFELVTVPRDEEEFMFKSQFLNYCCIRCTVYDYSLKKIKVEMLYDIEDYVLLFETTEEIKGLIRV